VVHVDLTFESFSVQGIETDLSTFTAGVPYHFVVENVGDREHELMIIEPVEPGAMDMEALDEMALYVVEEDDLAPGPPTSSTSRSPQSRWGQRSNSPVTLRGTTKRGCTPPSPSSSSTEQDPSLGPHGVTAERARLAEYLVGLRNLGAVDGTLPIPVPAPTCGHGPSVLVNVAGGRRKWRVHTAR
jgi:hypothetical protein